MPFLAGYITPQDYGAVGNNVTDDTTALQSALTAAAGKSLYIPAATYKISAALTIPNGSHVTILGDGPSNSMINQTSTTANGLTITDAIGITIQGIGFTGPSSGSGIGLSFVLGSNANTFQCDIRDLSVSSFGSHGISIATPTLCNLVRVVSQNNGGSGFNTTSSAASTTFQDCAANSNTSNGFTINNLSYGNFTGCASVSDGGIGFALTNCNSVALVASGAQNCTGNGFDISGGNTVSLLSCYTLTNNAVGVHFGSSHLYGFIQGYYDNSPGGGATNSIKVDSGCRVTVGANNVTTSQSLDPNGSTRLDGGTIVAAGNGSNSNMVVNRAATTNSATYQLATNGVEQWVPGGLLNNSTNDMYFQDAVNNVTATIYEQHPVASNVQMGSAKSFGGGIGVIGITNASTNPTTNPSGGGILYGASGVPNWRASDGGSYVLAPPAEYKPFDHFFSAWTYDPIATTTSTITVSGTIYLARVVVRSQSTLNKAYIEIATAASGVTANQNFIGLYDSSGTRQAVTTAGGIDAGLATTGVLVATFASGYSAAPGFYWLALVNNATTPVTIGRATGFQTVPNANLATANLRFAINGTSQTSLPTTITPGSNTPNNNITYWGAVSS